MEERSYLVVNNWFVFFYLKDLCVYKFWNFNLGFFGYWWKWVSE